MLCIILFSFLLSNAVTGFSLNDEEIEYDSYGKTYTGYTITYGKNNIKSKTAGNVSISFKDDNKLDIYHIHKLWTEYINDAYRGMIDPGDDTIINKILDYTGAIYYILTAADGETVLFWSKYYGVFPSSIPSTQYSWSSGSTVKPENLSINYQYSFKEDYNPQAIVEFNKNARIDTAISHGAVSYVPTYDSSLGHSSPTMVGTPYIEEYRNTTTGDFCYKLRFRPSPNAKDIRNYLRETDASMINSDGSVRDIAKGTTNSDGSSIFQNIANGLSDAVGNTASAIYDYGYNIINRILR